MKSHGVRRCVLGILLLVPSLLLAPSTTLARGNSSPVAQQAKPLDLSGVWMTSDGDKVALVQSGSSITTTFIGPGSCPNGSARSYYLQGQLSGTSISGNLQRCTSLGLLKTCSLTDPWTADIATATASNNQISGTYHGQYWKYNYDAKGNFIGCTEDPSQEHETSFSLSLMPCDSNAIQNYISALAKSDAELGRADSDTLRATAELDSMLTDYGNDAAKLGPVKLALKKALDAKLYGGTHTVVVGGLEISAMLYTYYWEYNTLYPFINQRLNLQVDAQTHTDQAAQIFNSAMQAAETELAQFPECKREADAIHAQSQFKDDLSSTIEGWEKNQQGYLYIDPNDPTHTPLSREAALKAAAQAITGGGKEIAGDLAAAAALLAPVGKNYHVTKAQVSKALHYLNIALSVYQSTYKWLKHKASQGKTFSKKAEAIMKQMIAQGTSLLQTP
jgi:hypothetical protein